MLQKDLILRQIEMISIILLRLTKQLKDAPTFEDVLVDFETLKEKQNIDIQELITIPKADLKSYLTENNILSNSFIDLANYLKALYVYFKKTDKKLSNSYLKTAEYLTVLYEEETGNAFFGRDYPINCV